LFASSLLKFSFAVTMFTPAVKLLDDDSRADRNLVFVKVHNCFRMDSLDLKLTRSSMDLCTEGYNLMSSLEELIL
jgi:hypothetical protein